MPVAIHCSPTSAEKGSTAFSAIRSIDIGAFEFAPSTFVLGDTNQDGVVDFSDIPSFISILQSGNFLDEADINGDGVVDFDDISFFVALLQAQ